MIINKNKISLALDARYLQEAEGGIYKYINYIIKEINKCYYDIYLITNKPIDIKYNNVKNIVIPQKYNWLYWEQIQLRKILKLIKPDIYHATSNWGVPFLCPCKVILTMHDLIPEKDPDYFSHSKIPFLSRYLYHLRVQSSLNKADNIICNSNQTRSDILNLFKADPSKTVIIPMGIDKNYLKSRSPKENKLIKMLRINRPYILIHGGLDYRKNIHRLIEAFSKIYNSNFNTGALSLIITGKNKIIEKELNQTINKFNLNGKVKLVGYISSQEIAVVVKNAAVICYPSLSEGFGFPVLEGMAAGVPVVASDLPVLRELGQDVPVYVDPYDVQSIAAGMETALRGLPQKRLDKGRLIAQNYTWDKVLKETVKIYSKVLNK